MYPPWRGTFYPTGLPQRRELEYLSHTVNTVEINGSFYSLQRPERYRSWYAQAPADFVFAVKGGRFITHMKRLRNVGSALANFFASGVLALEDKLGPILWQLPPDLPYEPERLSAFVSQLPRTTARAAELGRAHDDKLKVGPYLTVDTDRPLRHALEVRHPSYTHGCVPLLREHDIALVVSDSAGTWPQFEEVTSEFIYIRLHGDTELYTSGYTDTALRQWAEKINDWARYRDVYVYFDNDAKVRAPADALALAELLGIETAEPG